MKPRYQKPRRRTGKAAFATIDGNAVQNIGDEGYTRPEYRILSDRPDESIETEIPTAPEVFKPGLGPDFESWEDSQPHPLTRFWNGTFYVPARPCSSDEMEASA